MQKGIQLEFQGKRQHIFKDKLYNIRVFDNRIEMAEPDKPLYPKYVIKLDLSVKIGWLTTKKKQSNQLKGFLFPYQDTQKLMVSISQNLEKMKTLLHGKVLFESIADFYQPISVIGEGSFANVILCKCFQDLKNYAVKAIRKESLTNVERDQISLMNEVKIMQHVREAYQYDVDNQRFLRLHEIFIGDVTYYLVMDLIKGKSLDKELELNTQKKTLFSKETVKQIMRQLMDAVYKLHKLGIMHRDIKPDNIMFGEENSVDSLRIIDFGLATYVNVDNYIYSRCGTPGYVAPEVLNLKHKEKKYSEVCDIFSCGAIFYQLLTGKKLFHSRMIEKLIQINKQCIIDFNTEEMQALDKIELDLLKSMLQVDPKKRFKASEVLSHRYFRESDKPNDNKPQIHNTITTKAMGNQNISLNLQFQTLMVRSQDIDPQQSQRSEAEQLTKLIGVEGGIQTQVLQTQNQPKFLQQQIQNEEPIPDESRDAVVEMIQSITLVNKSSSFQKNHFYTSPLKDDSEIHVVNSFYMKSPLSGPKQEQIKGSMYRLSFHSSDLQNSFHERKNRFDQSQNTSIHHKVTIQSPFISRIKKENSLSQKLKISTFQPL